MLTHFALSQLAAGALNAPWTGTTPDDIHFDLSTQGSDEFVVALPGTRLTDIREWFLDFSFWPTWIPGIGYVHTGFGAGAQAVWAKILPGLPTDKLITFTGYSLGGAIASCLAAMYAAERPGFPFRLVTFGAPRPAFLNLSFGRLLSLGEEKTFYARNGDIVPDLPSPLYLHGGPQTDIGTSVGNAPQDHLIAYYAKDLKALGV